MNKSNFRLQTKLCNVHMTVFEIAVHRNVDNWIQFIGMTFIIGADNSSIDSGRILAIQLLTLVHEHASMQLKQ